MRETRETVPRDRERDQLATALPAYEIGAVLGRGSFAVVYAARHRRLDREVAIKRLSPVLLVEADARERFAAEARLLASLDHPHIVRVHRRRTSARSSWSACAAARLVTASHAGPSPTRGRSRSCSARCTGSSTRTARASCTATSSPRTCCSATRPRSRSPTSGSPRSSAPRARG
ncbi:MAG: hypothetical protein E6G10_09300 [Actinobacteria bacterium]|nr:MAG: hypothetical protein E6G10_09300 [Actinomycetota bacterium]